MKIMFVPDEHNEPTLVILLFVISQIFGFINLLTLQQVAAILTITVALKTLFGIKTINLKRLWLYLKSKF